MWASFLRQFKSWFALFNEKTALSLKVINKYNIISFEIRVLLMSPPQNKALKIDTVSQNKLNAIKKHEILRKFQKPGSRILEATPRGLLSEKKNILVSPKNKTIGFKVGLLI